MEEITSDLSPSKRDRPTQCDSIQFNCTQLPAEWLTDTHRKDLEASGLNQDQIKKTAHFSADKATVKKLVGVFQPGLIFSYKDPLGKPYLKQDGKPFYRVKPDWGDFKTEDSPKYLSPKNEGCRPYFSCLYSNWAKALKSTKIELWETEGEKKADCGCANGLPVIAFAGVDAWVDRCDRETGKQLAISRPLPELSVIDWKNRRVNQCFDSDIIEKQSVQRALAKRAKELQKLGALPYLILLPNEIDGAKNGLDDFVVRHGIEALKVLAKAAKPTSVKTNEIENENEQGEKQKETVYWLQLEEPESHQKALMAWSVMKERWAYRPGIGWYKWQGKHWKLKTLDEFESDLTRFMDAQNWEKRSSGLITSVVRELKSRLQVQDEDWAPFGKIALQNGTLDYVSGQFVPTHNPNDWITQLRPYTFNLSAQCPTWLNFITEAMEGDKERIELIRAIFRHAVLPKPKDCKAEIEKSFDLFGQKGTGKGTTLDILIKLVGSENVASVSVDTFKTPTGLGQLLDKTLAVDPDASGFLSNIGSYNKVVSNELVEVKKLYQDTCTTRLGVVVIRAYNAFIEVPDGSEGLDRRLTIIPFRHQPKNIDIELSQKLERELSGIFAWCYSMSTKEMKQRILRAGEIKAVAEISVERFEANNPEYSFLCAVFPDGRDRIKAGELYNTYQKWCRENKHYPKTSVKFARTIQALGCQRYKGKTNGNFYYRIPSMADFNVLAHLGIVQGQLGDNYRDSSNLYLEQDRDSCRRLGTRTLQSSDEAEFGAGWDKGGEDKERKSSERSPTVPEHYLEQVSIIPQLFQSVSTSVSGLPPRDLDNLVECENQVKISKEWQPKAGDLVEVLDGELWKRATLIQPPQDHNDPTKSTSFWRVRLDNGKKIYVWRFEQIRLLQA